MGDIEHLGDTVEAAAAQIEKECERLTAIVTLLVEGLDSPADELGLRVERGLRELVAHERELDGSMGVHQRLMEAAPEMYGRVRLLQTEHGSLTQAARRLWEACHASQDPEEIDGLREDLRTVVEKIERHRRETLDVIDAARRHGTPA